MIAFLEALDRLDDLVLNGWTVPLNDRQVMIDRDQLAAVAAQLSAPSDRALERIRDEHVRELHALLAAAKPVPLTGRVRIDKEAVFAGIDKIRTDIVGEPDASSRFLRTVEALEEEVVLSGGSIERDKLTALAAHVTVPREADLGSAAERRPALLEHVRELQALVAAAKRRRFSDDVRVDVKALSGICNAIRDELLSPDEP